jgi:hypothetical protein
LRFFKEEKEKYNYNGMRGERTINQRCSRTNGGGAVVEQVCLEGYK